MTQKYKAIYFPDFPNDESKQKSLTLAFGSNTDEIFERVKNLTSEEIRQLLGSDSYKDIAYAARTEDLPLNRYCLRQIKKSLTLIHETKTQYVLPGITTDEHIFNPLSVTFKGGAQEPFVRWYPYLQGYSTQYVEEIIKKYANEAKTILDPFAGTGTTVFTASRMNINSYFCEINPVLQYICLTKIKIRKLNAADRLRIFEKLIERKKELADIQNYERDNRLDQSYSNCFGDSQFFNEKTYDEVLRVRSWIDHLSLENPQLADLVTIAVLSALVPASKMTRVGDLRYKTANELKKNALSFIQQVIEGIGKIALDISGDVNGLKSEPLLIAENALSIDKIPCLNVDTVITSPPYVNGTNYFRNTKIELWFLRCLNDKNDLTRYRAQALTAGINDVTIGKARVSQNQEVSTIVAALQENAYDSRIPKMISSYFSELTEVFDKMRKHLMNKAIVAVDIGDSCYGGIHVPVDRLLSLCIQPLGYREHEATDLRKRRSKGGSILKQKLMVYRYEPDRTPFYALNKPLAWKSGWEMFQTCVPHQQLPYIKRNWGHSLHSLCSYPGKMKPAIAHFLVKTFVPESGKVLDPFAGVGTIPFEAGLQGKMSYGFEISLAAFVISMGKTQVHSSANCNVIINNLDSYINNEKPNECELKETRTFGFNGKLIDYYHSETLREIILARRFFRKYPARTPEDFFVLASLLHILHGNRPYALSRRSHPITPYKPTGEFEYRPLIPHLKAKVVRGLSEQLPSKFKTSKIYLQDATNWWPKEIEDIDAVITSPPFFDSTRFYLANWIRLWFCGWNQLDFAGRPLGFVEERQKVSFDVYLPVLRQAREHLRTNGVFVFHLGKSAKCDMSENLLELGRKWFGSAEIFEESVAHCESHGIRDKGAVSFHQYLVLH